MIEDEELRIIFKTASEEHLQKLEDGILHLEKFPDDLEKLEELMREAHSLKGDAGMLGVKDVATLSHQIEHLLGALKRSETTLSPEISDRLYHGLDAIRKLIREAVTGEASGVVTFYVLAHLMGASTEEVSPQTDTKENEELPIPEASENQEASVSFHIEPLESSHLLTTSANLEFNSVPTPLSQLSEPINTNTQNVVPYAVIESELTSALPALNPQSTENGEVNTRSLPSSPASLKIQPQAQEENKTVPQQTYRIDTIRVETHYLDSLMTQAGELTVTKTRLNHRLAEIEELVTLCEEWSRDAFVNRFILEAVETQLAVTLPPNQDIHLSPILSSRQLGNGAKPLSQLRTWKDGRGTVSIDRENNRTTLKQLQHFHHRTHERLERLNALINRLRNAVYEDTQRLDVISQELDEGIRTLRLLPLNTIFSLFPRMVRDLARQEGKQINLVIEGGETKADKRILEEMKDPLMHMIRNAIDHGIETIKERTALRKTPTATIRLRGYQTSTNIIIEVIDDGRGLELEKIKQAAIKRGLCLPEQLVTMTPTQIHSLIFEPGFSTRTFVTEVSGRGVGLDVVRTNVERLKGTIHIESLPAKGCTIRLQLPTTLVTAHVLIVLVNDISYAIPVEFVQTARFVAPDDIFTLEGRNTIVLNSVPISVVHLADLLELGSSSSQSLVGAQSLVPITHTQHPIPCIILKVGDELLGLLVDALLDEQDVMLKPQSQLLKRVRNVTGATILGTGEVCMILNPQDLIKSVRKQASTRTDQEYEASEVKATDRKLAILLVEDSIATRTQEKRILEGAGYEVVTAVDGLDGFNKLRTRSFDAVVSDIQMPNLDGLGLTEKIRQYKEYSELPIILVTSLASDEDKRKGAEAGANAYITKGTFNQGVLLETLRRLV